MNNSQSKSYADAGVDITAGYKAVELMKAHIAKTVTAGVCSDVGGFGGLFELDVKGYEHPVLVSGTDGSEQNSNSHSWQTGIQRSESTVSRCASTTLSVAEQNRFFSSTISRAAKTCPRG